MTVNVILAPKVIQGIRVISKEFDWFDKKYLGGKIYSIRRVWQAKEDIKAVFQSSLLPLPSWRRDIECWTWVWLGITSLTHSYLIYCLLTAILNTTIHDLSPEILRSIFLLATNHFQDPFGSIVSSIILSHVSYGWREFAISIGSLWTSIILTFPISLNQLSRSTTWLWRSKQYPIDIFLDFRDPSWDWEEDVHRFSLRQMAPILKILLAHVERWRHFELLSDTWEPIHFFLRNTRNVEAAPLLQSLSLSRCNAYFASKNAAFQPVDLQLPIPLFGGLALDALRDVSLVGVHVDWGRSSLRNLKSLAFKYHAGNVMPSLDQFLDILSGCLELRHLSIVGWGPRFERLEIEGNTRKFQDTATEARRIIQLRHLVQFTFGFVDVNYAVKVLSLFDFPSIQELTLEDVSFTLNPMEYQDATPILDWLTPSADDSSAIPRTVCGIPLNGILSLQLYSIHASNAAFSSFFLALPNLQKVGLFNVADFTLRGLHPSSDPCIPHPCPNLREIKCLNVDPTTLMDLLLSREKIESILPLKSILFDFDDTLQPLTHDDSDFIELNDVEDNLSRTTDSPTS